MSRASARAEDAVGDEGDAGDRRPERDIATALIANGHRNRPNADQSNAPDRSRTLVALGRMRGVCECLPLDFRHVGRLGRCAGQQQQGLEKRGRRCLIT